VPPAPLPPELVEFVRRPHPAVIATVRPDGSPHSVPTWYDWEDGRVLVNMSDSRKRLDNIRANPHVSLTVLGQGDDWYHQITLRGRVVSLEPDPGLEGIDRLSRRYTGEPYARREQVRVNAWIEVDWWYGWEMGKPWTGEGA
jgi:PPOX class probable F420-dependent enzyme